MSDYKILRTELTTDPLVRGYSGMTDTQAATSLATVNRTINRTSVPAVEVIEALVASEYAALSTTLQNMVGLLISAGTINPLGTNTRAIFAAAFGPATTTRANLIALETMLVSRAVELGLGYVSVGDVKIARSGVW